MTFVLEPGRVLVGNTGILLTRVLYTKEAEKNFVIVDAGMNDLARPAVYDSYHEVVPVIRREGEAVQADVVGPICESTDYLAKDRRLVGIERGDLLAVMSAGAYSFSMSSNYNSRPRAAEVLVDGSIIRDHPAAGAVRGPDPRRDHGLIIFTGRRNRSGKPVSKDTEDVV